VEIIKIKIMKRNIFINLGTGNLEKAKEFFAGLGFKINPDFTDKNAACVVIDENIFAMIVDEDFFRKFTKKEIVDARKLSECAVCLSCDSEVEVDELMDKALSMGATENIVPEMQEGDSMYGRSFSDLDGHVWELMWMAPKTTE
jgi:predicted lactoylglutathione lyase